MKQTHQSIFSTPRTILSLIEILSRLQFVWLIIGIFGTISFLHSCSQKPQTLRAEYQTLIEAVYASGNIVPKNEYKVFSLADGTIIQKSVSEGDLVKKGQLLFQIASEVQDARLKNSLENLRLAQGNYQDNSPILRELKIMVENAKIKLKNDSIQYFRYKNLWENEAASKSDYDRAILNYQTAQNDFKAKLNNYEKVRNDLYLAWQNAQSQYISSADDGANHLITSKIDGKVYEIYKEEGEAVRRNDVVALLGNDTQVIIKLSVDELDIPKIKIGQEILVKIDIYKDKIFKAKVSKIYPRLNASDQSFRVDAEFLENSPTQFSGLSIEANIIIQKKDRALTLPKSLLLGGDSVMVFKEGKSQKIKIKKGLETLDKVEIIEGITDKDEIIL